VRSELYKGSSNLISQAHGLEQQTSALLMPNLPDCSGGSALRVRRARSASPAVPTGQHRKAPRPRQWHGHGWRRSPVRLEVRLPGFAPSVFKRLVGDIVAVPVEVGVPLPQKLLSRGVTANLLTGVVVASRGSRWRRCNGTGAGIAMLGILQAGHRYSPERGRRLQLGGSICGLVQRSAPAQRHPVRDAISTPQRQSH
jgi:hypothetical protein